MSQKNKKSCFAPICLFVFSRLEETKLVVGALKKCPEASSSELFIFSDGPRTREQCNKVNSLRKYIRGIKGFAKITVIESEENKGLARSIVGGVSHVLSLYKSIIVLEDDIIVSPHFLKYMNDGLEYYINNPYVMHIAGYMFPINPDGLPETFFYQANSCWGWGTWRHSWEMLEIDTSKILVELSRKKISWAKFNAMQCNEYKRQLFKNHAGTISTWAVKWHAAMLINGGTALHPKQTLVANIGFSGNGENCPKETAADRIDQDFSPDITVAEKADITEVTSRLCKYFNQRYSLISKIYRRLSRLLS